MPAVEFRYDMLNMTELDMYWAQGLRVHMAAKRDYVIPMKVRMARVEDHDALIKVFDEQSEFVSEVYGDYFLAELIESQNNENKALVAEDLEG